MKKKLEERMEQYVKGWEQFEKINEPLFDTEIMGRADINALNFFISPIDHGDKLKQETNMTLPGMMPVNNLFLVKGFGIRMYKATHTEYEDFRTWAAIEFFIGWRSYFKSPAAECMPPLFTSVDYAEEDRPFFKAIETPLLILENQNFHAHVSWGRRLTVDPGAVLRVVLEGQLLRRAQ